MPLSATPVSAMGPKIVGWSGDVNSSRSIPAMAKTDPMASASAAHLHTSPRRKARNPNAASASHMARAAQKDTSPKSPANGSGRPIARIDHREMPRVREDRRNRAQQGEPWGHRGLPPIHANDDRDRADVEQHQPEVVQAGRDIDDKRGQQDGATEDPKGGESVPRRRALRDT